MLLHFSGSVSVTLSLFPNVSFFYRFSSYISISCYSYNSHFISYCFRSSSCLPLCLLIWFSASHFVMSLDVALVTDISSAVDHASQMHGSIWRRCLSVSVYMPAFLRPYAFVCVTAFFHPYVCFCVSFLLHPYTFLCLCSSGYFYGSLQRCHTVLTSFLFCIFS